MTDETVRDQIAAVLDECEAMTAALTAVMSHRDEVTDLRASIERLVLNVESGRIDAAVRRLHTNALLLAGYRSPEQYAAMEAERDRWRTVVVEAALETYEPEGAEIVVQKIHEYARRAEQAEAALAEAREQVRQQGERLAAAWGLHAPEARGPNADELLDYCQHCRTRYPCRTVTLLAQPEGGSDADE